MKKKGLGKLDAITLAFGAMIGWGWVVMSGEWITKAGTFGAILAFILGGIMVLFVGKVYAELLLADEPENVRNFLNVHLEKRHPLSVHGA